MKLKPGWKDHRDGLPKTWIIDEENDEVICQACAPKKTPATSFFMNFLVPVCEEHRGTMHGFFDFNDKGHGRPDHECDDNCIGGTIGAKPGDAVLGI